MLFAEAVPDAALGSWMQIAFYVLGSIAALVVAYKKINEPSKAETMPVTHSELDTFATRAEMHRLEKDVDKVQDTLRRMNSSTRKSIHRLGNGINQIALRLAEMNVTLKLVAKRTGVDGGSDHNTLALPQESEEEENGN